MLRPKMHIICRLKQKSIRENSLFQRVWPCRQALNKVSEAKTPALPVARLKAPLTRSHKAGQTRGFKPRNRGDRDFESLADGDLEAVSRPDRLQNQPKTLRLMPMQHVASLHTHNFTDQEGLS